MEQNQNVICPTCDEEVFGEISSLVNEIECRYCHTIIRLGDSSRMVADKMINDLSGFTKDTAVQGHIPDNAKDGKIVSNTGLRKLAPWEKKED